jgi:hypothetical protein
MVQISKGTKRWCLSEVTCILIIPSTMSNNKKVGQAYNHTANDVRSNGCGARDTALD